MSIEAFRQQRAVEVSVPGDYVLPNWYDQHGRLRKFACRTKRVSPFRMMVDVPVVGRIGDFVNSYFAEFGRLSGRIVDTVADSFLLDLSMPAEMRARLSGQLDWIERKKKDPTLADARRHPRIVPEMTRSAITLADGSIHDCSVIDVSVSGVAVGATLKPPVGTVLAVGVVVGRVVRHMPKGVAIQFVDLQKRSSVEKMITSRARHLDIPGEAVLQDGPDDSWMVEI